jgi:thiamine kinase-like enzyme
MMCLMYDAETIRFIDFELVGYNYQAFDFACHFCEYAGNFMSELGANFY